VSENLDFAMEISKNETLLEFKGVLKTENFSSVRDRLFSSVDGYNKIYFVNIEQAKFKDKSYLNMFLEFFNFVKGKDSELVIIFHNEDCADFFRPFFNIFKIYDSRDSYRKNTGFWEKLKATGITYQRSTGLRLAPGVAIVFLFLLGGWLLTLFSIISSQDKDIRNREAVLNELQSKYMRSEQALENLKASVAPLKSMGFSIDTSGGVPLGAISDWEEFLREKGAGK
jgi:anti-anti-sigma regulatory factor